MKNLILLITLLFPTIAYAAPDMSVTSVSGAPGSTVSVYVTADYPKPVSGLQFSITFDPNLLTYTSSTNGPSNSSWSSPVTFQPGQGKLNYLSFTTNAPVSGPSLQVAVINFTVNAPPAGYSATSSPLTLSAVELANTDHSGSSAVQLAPGIFSLPGSDQTQPTAPTNDNNNTNQAGPQSAPSATGTVTNSSTTNNSTAPANTMPNNPTSPAATGIVNNSMSNNTAQSTGQTAPTALGAMPTVSGTIPSITTQPINQTVAETAAATFTVAAIGMPNPNYQWMESVDDGETFTPINSATNVSYTTPVASVTDSGDQYECVVTNSMGSVTSAAATLTVDVAPSITYQPSNQTVTAPDEATFSIQANGIPAPTYQWMQSVDNGVSFTSINGATAASYNIATTAVAQNGTQYKCVVTNAVGTVTSSAVKLTVNPKVVVKF